MYGLIRKNIRVLIGAYRMLKKNSFVRRSNQYSRRKVQLNSFLGSSQLEKKHVEQIVFLNQNYNLFHFKAFYYKFQYRNIT